GGLTITSVEQQTTLPDGTEIALDDYFEAALDEPPRASDGEGGAAAPWRQGLTLRCRFHLADAAMRRLAHGDGCYPLRVSARPTPPAAEDAAPADAPEWLVGRAYYAPFLEHFPEGIASHRPASILLRASGIALLPPRPRHLPALGAERDASIDDRYTSRLRATVVSGAGLPIPGSVIEHELGPSATRGWGFRVWYDPPEELWRREFDPGLSREESLFFPAAGVDQYGVVTFVTDMRRPYLAYNHAQHFRYPLRRAWRPRDRDDRNHYVRAQTCDLQVQFEAHSERAPLADAAAAADTIVYPAGTIHIDPTDFEYFDLTIRVRARSGEPLSGAEVVAGPAGALGWTAERGTPLGQLEKLRRGVTDSNGEFVAYMLPGRLNPYRVRVSWRTVPQPRHGGAAANGAHTAASAGTLVTTTVEGDVEGAEPGVEVTLDEVSTQWALLLTPAAGPAASGGELYAAAMLLQRPALNGHLDGRTIALGAADAALGAGAPWSVASASPEPTPFTTPQPVTWEDFEHSRGRLISLGVNGTSRKAATFDSLVTQPEQIDLASGSAAASPATNGQAAAGIWRYVSSQG